MKERKESGGTIGLETIMRSLDCPKKREFAGLGILDSPERLHFQNTLMYMQGEYFGKPEAPDKVRAHIDQKFQKNWTLCGMQYKVQKEEEAAYHMRMASFFIGKKTVTCNLRWALPVRPLCLGDLMATSVFGYVHAVTMEPDGTFTAYVLKSGTPIYSMRAKKAENRLENAPELLGAYLDLSRQYPGLKMSLVYRKVKNDAPSKSFSAKQILTVDFTDAPTEELQERFEQMIRREDTGLPDCEECRYQTLCRGLEIRLPKVIERPKSKGVLIFTKTQEKVIHFKKGPCVVCAVPGAGKTTALVHRMVHLLNDGVDPKNILFVTFTNKAADEIRSRARELLDVECPDELPNVYTYNGLGWQIIRDHPEIVGNLKLITPMDEKRLLLESIDTYGEVLKGFSYHLMEGKFGLINTLRRIFRQLEEDEEKAIKDLLLKKRDPSQVMALKKAYHAKMNAENYITYDEQISIACKILKDNEMVLKTYGQKWKYIMADEFQDSSEENVELIYMLANAGQKNIVVVGDADQSIFEWRNGSPEHLLEFEDAFPGAEKIFMADNFRSSRWILKASNALISNNKQKSGISIIPHKDGALPGRVRNCSLDQIPVLLEMLRKNRYQYGDIAILARTNAPLAKLKGILEKAGIGTISPSDHLIKDRFFVILKDILDLYLLGFEHTDLAFYRYLLSQGIHAPTKQNRKMSFYQNLVEYHGLIPLETDHLPSMLEYAVERNQQNGLFHAAKKLFDLFLTFDTGLSANDCINRVAKELGIPEEYPGIKTLKQCIDYEALENIKELHQYLEWMETFDDDAKVEHDTCPEKVNLLTAHSSKGKEFPAVIIVQCEDFKANEQERRLLYVAMTRAKKALFLLESPYMSCEMAEEFGDTVSAVNM